MEPPRRCTARTSAGAPCKRSPIAGGSVCATHGGRAPQVVAAARRRLLEAADGAAALLVGQLCHDDPGVAQRAAVHVLDRAGIARTSAVEVSGPAGGAIPVQVQAEELVELVEGLLDDLDIDVDDRVAGIVAGRLSMFGHAIERRMRGDSSPTFELE